MKLSIRITLATVTTSALLGLGMTAPAQADESNDPAPIAPSALGNVNLGTQYGSVLRARFSENYDGSGGQIRIYGSGSCTATTSDADFSYSVMPSGWNDQISRIHDYASCDTKLYADGGFTGATYGFVNAGSAGINLHNVGFHDRTSSFRLS